VTGDLPDASDVEPRANIRPSWANASQFVCVGAAEIDRPDGDTYQYGVYGVRGDELFVQYEQVYHSDGVIVGKSLAASSSDIHSYYWSPRSNYSRVDLHAAGGQQ
jgi:hypothetical protein